MKLAPSLFFKYLRGHQLGILGWFGHAWLWGFWTHKWTQFWGHFVIDSFNQETIGRIPRVEQSPEEKWEIAQEGIKSEDVSRIL